MPCGDYAAEGGGGSGTGGAGGSAGSAGAGGSGGGSGGSKPSGSDDDGGCGCRAPRRSGEPAFGALLLGLGALGLRRLRGRFSR